MLFIVKKLENIQIYILLSHNFDIISFLFYTFILYIIRSLSC